MLATKRVLPRPGSDMLARPRLLELVAEGIERPLTPIYRKLDVTDRRDCVDRARELRLLSPGLSDR